MDSDKKSDKKPDKKSPLVKGDGSTNTNTNIAGLKQKQTCSGTGGGQPLAGVIFTAENGVLVPKITRNFG